MVAMANDRSNLLFIEDENNNGDSSPVVKLAKQQSDKTNKNSK